MRFTSGNLLECAYERLEQALSILDHDPVAGSPLAAYVSGVAAECAIRAKRKVVSDQFNAGHRLDELANEANYASRLRGATLDAFNADLSRLTRQWDNLLRYCSTQDYVEFLVRRGVEVPASDGRVRASRARQTLGDTATGRLAAEETYACARRIVEYGEYFWERRR